MDGIGRGESGTETEGDLGNKAEEHTVERSSLSNSTTMVTHQDPSPAFGMTVDLRPHGPTQLHYCLVFTSYSAPRMTCSFDVNHKNHFCVALT